MRYLVLLLFISCATQVSTSNTDISAEDALVHEYELRLERLSSILAEQQDFATAIEENYDNATLHTQQVNSYLEWSEQTKPELQSTKDFIEDNYLTLLETGRDPIALRDLLRLMIESEERNEQFFERCDQIWQRYNA